MSAFNRPRFQEGLQLGEWTLQAGGRFTDDVWIVKDDGGRSGVIKTARGKKAPWVERFTHEVAALETLQPSPGVLRLLDRDRSSTPQWMVTELAEPLASHLSPAPDLGAIVSAFADIADTLVDAERRGISHRDIKPDNLFFARGRSVVGDFGLATGHDSPGLTGHGERVGPANFCAPEALDAHESIDWSAADVYSLTKSLWAILAEKKYPPQGPMYVRRQECDLGRFGGRAGEDLARLFEIATADSPSDRPSLSEFGDELRSWLHAYPAGSTPRPPLDYPNVFDEATSAAAVDEGGPAKILDDAVQKLLERCRRAGPDNGQILDDPDADVVPPHDPRAVIDPDWEPDHVAIKKLFWERAGGARLVAVGILEHGDDLTYRLAWQRRLPTLGSWDVTWQAEGRVRARLPSDLAERIRLSGEALRQRPASLGDPSTVLSQGTRDVLRRVTADAQERETNRARDLEAAKRLVKARQEAARKAKDELDIIWRGLVDCVNSLAEHDANIRTQSGDDSWILTLGDRRMTIWAGFPPAQLDPALLLGTVTVATDGEGDDRYKCDIANVCAVADSSGDPLWQLFRFRRNDLAKPPARVGQALFDGCGAINHNLLDELLRADFQGELFPPASLVSRDPLSVETLMNVVGRELEAIDRRPSVDAG